jgi:hypothetical protein
MHPHRQPVPRFSLGLVERCLRELCALGDQFLQVPQVGYDSLGSRGAGKTLCLAAEVVDEFVEQRHGV